GRLIGKEGGHSGEHEDSRSRRKIVRLFEAFLAAELDRMVAVNPAQGIRKNGGGITAPLRETADAAKCEESSACRRSAHIDLGQSNGPGDAAVDSQCRRVSRVIPIECDVDVIATQPSFIYQRRADHPTVVEADQLAAPGSLVAHVGKTVQ